MSGSTEKCSVALTPCDATTSKNFVCYSCFVKIMNDNGASASSDEYESCLSEFLKLLVTKNPSVEYRNNGSVINYDIFNNFDLIGFSSYDLERERSYACVKNSERGSWFLCNDQGVISLVLEDETSKTTTRGEAIRFSIPEKSADEAKLDHRVRVQLGKLINPSSKTLRAGANCGQRADELCDRLGRDVTDLEQNKERYILKIFEPIFLEYARRQYEIDCPKQEERPDEKKIKESLRIAHIAHNINLEIKSCVCTKAFLDQLLRNYSSDSSAESSIDFMGISLFGRNRTNRKSLFAYDTRSRCCRCHGLYFDTEEALEDHLLQYIWRVCLTVAHAFILRNFDDDIRKYVKMLKKCIQQYSTEPQRRVQLTLGRNATIFEGDDMQEINDEIKLTIGTFLPQHRTPPTISQKDWETVVETQRDGWLKIHKNTSIKTYPVFRTKAKDKTYYLPLLDTSEKRKHGTFHYETSIVDIMNVAKQENRNLYERLKPFYEQLPVTNYSKKLVDLLVNEEWKEWWHCLGLPEPYEENHLPEGVQIQWDKPTEDVVLYGTAHDARLFTPRDYVSWRYMDQQTINEDIKEKYKQHQTTLKNMYIAPKQPFKRMTDCVAQASVLIYKRTAAVKDHTVWSTSPPFIQPTVAGVQETALQLAMVYPPCHTARDEETKFSNIFNTIKKNHHNYTVQVNLLGHPPNNSKKIYEYATHDNIIRKLNMKDLVKRFSDSFDKTVHYYTILLTVEIDTRVIAEALGCDTRDDYRIEDILKVYKINHTVVPIIADNREEVYLSTCLDKLFRTIDATVPIDVFRAIFLGRDYERVKNIYVTFQPSRNDNMFSLEETSSGDKPLQYDYGVGKALHDILLTQKAIYNPIKKDYSNLMILRTARGTGASSDDNIGPVRNNYDGNGHRNAAHINIRPSEYLSDSDIQVEKMEKHQHLVWDLEKMVKRKNIVSKTIKGGPHNPYMLVKSNESKWYILYGDYIIVTLDRGYAPIPENISDPVEDFIAFSKKKLSKKHKREPEQEEEETRKDDDANRTKKRKVGRMPRAENIV